MEMAFRRQMNFICTRSHFDYEVFDDITIADIYPHFTLFQIYVTEP